MDEQLSTWMDWIWSSRCLELLRTSTQSSNLKWVSGGGINSPRHSASHWLKALWKVYRRMNRHLLFRSIGSSGAPPTSHSHWGSLTELLWRYAPTLRQFIRCWRTSRQTVSIGFFVTVGQTDAAPWPRHRFIWCWRACLGVYLSSFKQGIR
jgi:hypothetical protein